MANKTIPQLIETTTLDPTDVLAVDDGIQTFKATMETVENYITTTPVIARAAETIPSGYTRMYGALTIPVGQTWTVESGGFLSVFSALTVLGDLSCSGTTSVVG